MNVSFLKNGESLLNNELRNTGETLVELLNYPEEKYDEINSVFSSIFEAHKNKISTKKILPLIYKASELLYNAPFYRYNYIIEQNIFYESKEFDKIYTPKKVQFMKDFIAQISAEQIDDKSVAFDIIYFLGSDLIETERLYKKIINNLMQKYKNITLESYFEYLVNDKKVQTDIDMCRSIINFDPYVAQTGLSTQIDYDVYLKNNEYFISQSYEISYLGIYIYYEFYNMLASGHYIKKCRNCNNYFLITNGHDAEYCGNIPKGENKPCFEIGPLRAYTEKVKGDPFLSLYNKAYKTHYARRKKTTGNKKMTPDEFMTWCDDAKQKLKQARTGSLSLTDYTEWLKK